MTSAEDQQNILDEVLVPHLASEEGQAFLGGQIRLENFQAALAHASPPAAEEFKALMLRFMWQRVSMLEVQSTLRTLVSAHEKIITELDFYPIHIVPYLDMDICSPEDELRAKGVLCQTFGLVTQSGSADAQTWMEQGTKLMGDIKKRFHSEPEKYKFFTHTIFNGWRTGDDGMQDKEKVRNELMETLKGDEDLLERAKEIWPIFAEGGF